MNLERRNGARSFQPTCLSIELCPSICLRFFFCFFFFFIIIICLNKISPVGFKGNLSLVLFFPHWSQPNGSV